MRVPEIEEQILRCEFARGDGASTCLACGAPIPARRRRFCSNPCGREWSDQHRWEAARLLALERDGYRCTYVGCSGEDVEVHHVLVLPDRTFYRRVGCWHHVAGLRTLCKAHHVEEHRFDRKVAAYLTWADGVVSEQMELPLAEPVAA